MSDIDIEKLNARVEELERQLKEAREDAYHSTETKWMNRALISEKKEEQAKQVIMSLGGFIKGMCVALSPVGFRPETVGGSYIEVLRYLIEKQLGLKEGELNSPKTIEASQQMNIAIGGMLNDIVLKEKRLREALIQISQWDMLNPPDMTERPVLSDLPWLKKLVDDALG